MPPPPPPALRLGRDIEIHCPDRERGSIRHCVFDFDGTLSLVRAGWQEVMLGFCVSELEKVSAGEDPQALEALCLDFIARLTGRQTIYQMIRLAEEVEKRGGEARPPLDYKKEYLERLHQRIAHRLQALRQGADPAPFLVRGAPDLLAGLQARGATLYLASGTDHPHVVEETGLLGLMSFFGERVYGARDDYLSFSKKMLIERILTENKLRGPELAVFGDGYVEIENGRQAGGLAVGVASVESGEGGWDAWKQSRLLEVGADILVPDWQEASLLLSYLYGETP